MPIRPRPPAFRLAAALLAALLLMAVTAGSAAAAPTSAAPGSGGVLRAAPTSAAAVAGGLERATGHTPAQLSTRQPCGAAAPGRMRCLAQVLTVRGTGRAVPLLRTPHTRPMRTAPGGSPAGAAGITGAGGTAATATTAAGAVSAPQPYTAAFLQWAYDTTWLSANNGGGDTVAIVDAYHDPSAYSDMEAFRSVNGLPSLPLCSASVTNGCFQLVNQYGSAAPLPSQSADETGSWNIEESLDIDAVSALCPSCKILMVEANSDSNSDLGTGVQTAAAMGANQISMSWGSDVGSATKPPNAQKYSYPYTSITGSALLAAAGDDSYPGQYTVGYPAALANVTAVGGTSLTGDPTAARGFAESAWAIQTCSGGLTCGTESGCDTSQGVPTYQQGLTTDCSGRAYNDISADADPNTGLAIYDSQSGSEGCQTSNNMCIVGGTSLATPLTAAFEAITGVGGPSAGSTSPSWAYGDAAKLNDIVSGSDGTCPAGESVICTAGTGWDGPTGNGSISGDIVAGGPGIGAQPDATKVAATSADVSATVNPNNGTNTTYYWQYGPTTSYGADTNKATVTATFTFTSATAALSLPQPCTYHYRLVASNDLGTVYGYDHTVTPTQPTTPPVNGAAPTISGTAAIGQQLVAQPGTWSGVLCDTTYQWRRSSSAGGPWTPISGATAPTYTPSDSDGGEYLDVVVTQSNSAGSVPATSPPTSEVPAPPPAPSTTTTATTTTPTSTPSPPTVTAPAPPPAPTVSAHPSTLTTVRFYRCIHGCVLIETHGASSYRTRRADYGRYIKVVTTLTRTTADGTTRTVATRWFGPIVAPTAGVVSIGAGARIAATLVVRGARHRPLALVRIVGHHGSRLTLAITRAGRLRTQFWAYVVSRGAVRLGTAPRLLAPHSRLSVTLRRGQTLKLVAVAT